MLTRMRSKRRLRRRTSKTMIRRIMRIMRIIYEELTPKVAGSMSMVV